MASLYQNAVLRSTATKGELGAPSKPSAMTRKRNGFPKPWKHPALLLGVGHSPRPPAGLWPGERDFDGALTVSTMILCKWRCSFRIMGRS